MEVWDVYDKYRNLTGKTVLRGDKDPFEDGEYELVVHVALFNKKGEMLIQQRQSTKKMFPNCWDISAGGHSISGEDSEEAIQRELFEELGYYHDFSNEMAKFTINRKHGFGDFYTVVDNELDLDDLKVQYEEVQNITWASKDEILQLINEEKFVPYTEGLIELLFFMKDRDGIIKRKDDI